MQKETNIMPRVAAFENILKADAEASRGKQLRPEVVAWHADIEHNIIALSEDFLNNTYESGLYREGRVFVPQLRIIQIQQFRDRVAQQAIYQILGPILDRQYIEHSYACRKGKGALNAAEQLQYWLRQIDRKPDAGDYVAGKMDVAKFFYRMPHVETEDVLAQYVDDRIFQDTMHRIICCKHTPFGLPEGKKPTEVAKEERLFDVGFPIGSLNSQTSANMDMNEVDQFAKHVLHIKYYIRYMDDIVILHNDLKQLQEWMRQIEAFLYARLKLRCNSKTGIIQLSHGIPFVGKRIWPSHILLRKSTVQHMKHSLKHLAGVYATGEVELSYVKQVMASYFGLLSHCDSYTIRLWIAENIVFKRNEGANDYPELVHLQDTDWRDHFKGTEEDFYDALLQA